MKLSEGSLTALAATQGWLFLDSDFWGSAQMSALLGSVARGSMLVLDLDSANREQYTRTSSYHGQPFIFNMLHTFGGQVGFSDNNIYVDVVDIEWHLYFQSKVLSSRMSLRSPYSIWILICCKQS